MTDDDLIRVLFVEDSPTAARLIKAFLSQSDESRFTVHHTASLAEGLEAFHSTGADVVLLDLSLPDSRGLDTFLAMQRHAPRAPIVVLSGHDDQDLAVEALRCGAQDYLLKGKTDHHLLIRSLLYAIQRVQAEAERRQKQRLQGALELAAAACHELNQPLQAVAGHTDLLLESADPKGPLERRVRIIKEQVDRLTQITRKLRRVTRYVTTDYLEGERIIDLDRATEPREARAPSGTETLDAGAGT